MTAGWKLFAPIPDPVGFGGMFAGALDGKLVAGGGSQFREKPTWLKGEKSFTDKIWVLDDPAGPWRESVTRLPQAMGHFASAANGDAIYLAGGIDPSGCLRQCLALRASGTGYAFETLPDLPEAVGYAAGAILDGRMYVVGGQPSPTAKTPLRHVWSLGLTSDGLRAGWRQEPDFPGTGRFVVSTAVAAGRLFVIGGVGFNAAGNAVPSQAVCSFDPASRHWTTLPDLPSARVGPSTPCPVVEGKIWVIGGYEKIFPGAPRDHPGFDAQTFAFDLAASAWRNGPVLPSTPVTNRDEPGDPGPAPMLGAPCAIWHGYAVIVGGEVRASVRTPGVIGWPLSQSFTP